MKETIWKENKNPILIPKEVAEHNLMIQSKLSSISQKIGKVFCFACDMYGLIPSQNSIDDLPHDSKEYKEIIQLINEKEIIRSQGIKIANTN